MEVHLEALLELIFYTKPPNFEVEAHMKAFSGVAPILLLPTIKEKRRAATSSPAAPIEGSINEALFVFSRKKRKALFAAYSVLPSLLLGCSSCPGCASSTPTPFPLSRVYMRWPCAAPRIASNDHDRGEP
jgi:hypothetical protein